MAGKRARHVKTPKAAVFHGLRNALAVLFAGREALKAEGHVTSAEGLEVLKDMEAAETKARRCLEALTELV